MSLLAGQLSSGFLLELGSIHRRWRSGETAGGCNHVVINQVSSTWFVKRLPSRAFPATRFVVSKATLSPSPDVPVGLRAFSSGNGFFAAGDRLLPGVERGCGQRVFDGGKHMQQVARDRGWLGAPRACWNTKGASGVIYNFLAGGCLQGRGVEAGGVVRRRETVQQKQGKDTRANGVGCSLPFSSMQLFHAWLEPGSQRRHNVSLARLIFT